MLVIDNPPPTVPCICEPTIKDLDVFYYRSVSTDTHVTPWSLLQIMFNVSVNLRAFHVELLSKFVWL